MPAKEPVQVEPALAKLFPLPCTPYEKYMLLDDSQSHPMSSFMEFDLSGPLDIERLRYALELVLPRHPLFLAKVSALGRTANWILDGTVPQLPVVTTDEQLTEDERLDLIQTTGLRLWIVQRQPQWATLVMLCHHACADALGMLTFVTEWLAVYADDTQKLPPICPEALRDRGRIATGASFGWWQRMRRIGAVFGGRKPSLLKPSSQSVTATQSDCCVARLNREQLAALRAAAKQRRVTLNDWLAAVLLGTIHQWNHDGEDCSDTYRLVVPVNQRSPKTPFTAAMNRISYKLLTRSLSEQTVFSSLLQSVHDEMEPVRAHPQGVTSFLKLLKWADRLDLMPALLQRQSQFATVVFTNLGDFARNFEDILERDQGKLKAGDLTIEQLLTAPPRRINTHATICIVSYGEELHLMSRGDGRGLNYPDTQAFLNLFRNDVLKSITPQSPEGES